MLAGMNPWGSETRSVFEATLAEPVGMCPDVRLGLQAALESGRESERLDGLHGLLHGEEEKCRLRSLPHK